MLFVLSSSKSNYLKYCSQSHRPYLLYHCVRCLKHRAASMLFCEWCSWVKRCTQFAWSFTIPVHSTTHEPIIFLSVVYRCCSILSIFSAKNVTSNITVLIFTLLVIQSLYLEGCRSSFTPKSGTICQEHSLLVVAILSVLSAAGYLT